MPTAGGRPDCAAQLHSLKQRSGRSYDALAAQLGMSSSALHRYCSGASLPPEFGVIEAFGRLCGAQPDELVELYRAWVHADAARKPELNRIPETARGTELPTKSATDPGPRPDTGRRAGHSRLSRRGLAGLAAGIVVMAAGIVTADAAPSPTEHQQHRRQPAAADGCPAEVKIGEHDACARTVQSLLAQAGAVITVDGDFGPETLKRVTAFQVLAGLPPDGVVDAQTRRVLESGKVTMQTWTPLQVATLIRAVFPEEPDRALGIARCKSFLDPLHLLPNSNGSRNWGVFQISDVRLAQLGGTPRQALDPEWNVRAARRLWSQNKDFRHWLDCDQPYQPLTGAPVTWAGQPPAMPFVACPPPSAAPQARN